MTSSILKEIAELSNPTPHDYDPEDIAAEYEASDSDTDKEVDAGREHYVEVGKSKLKTVNTILKDPKYRGKAVSREELFGGVSQLEGEEESSEEEEPADLGDDAAETSGDEVFEGESEADVSVDDEEEEEMSESEASESDEMDVEEEEEEQDDRREKVRELLAQETKTVTEQLNESAQADVEKGQDIKKQLKFYDSLLDARIRLQKGLLALNSLPQGDIVENYVDGVTLGHLETAKQDALDLFVHILELRKQLLPDALSLDTSTLKRKFDDTTVSELEEASETYRRYFNPWRDEVLTKWSEKVKAASGLPVNKKFKALNQSITHQLRENLTDRDRLIERTRTKRATFSILGTTELEDDRKETISPEIFDDTDFYHPLLKEFVERKSLDIAVETWTRPTKVKNNNKDTRASKGRKLRYHEHEKIQNFMAPMAAGTWHEEQIEYCRFVDVTNGSELFASLLGRRIQVEEEKVAKEPEPVLANNDGLRIFG